MGEHLGNGLSDLWDAITSLGTDIGGFFSDLGDGISNGFTDMYNNASDILTNIGDGFSSVGDSFTSVLDYLNPTSDKFFLKLAFIPSDDYMTAYKDDFNNAIQSKFAFFYQVKDMFDSIVSSVQSNVDQWDGVKVDFTQYHMGEVTIIDPKFANVAIPKMKFWIGGLMYFMTAMFIIRKVSNVLGAGK